MTSELRDIKNEQERVMKCKYFAPSCFALVERLRRVCVCVCVCVYVCVCMCVYVCVF